MPIRGGLKSVRGVGGGIGGIKGIRGTTPDLSTSEGLYQLATQFGIQKQADRVLADKGEETKKIFSGGFISDIFDALNTLQYGVVGMLKGKSFAEGVKSRQSWSDKDALGEFGIPGMVGGIALDIACDPLTYVPIVGVAKRVGLVGKLKGVTKVAKATKLGKFLGSKLIYRFGQDPIYKALDVRRIRNIAVGQANMKKLIEPIIKIPVKAGLLTRTKTGSFIRTPLAKLKGILTKDELWDATKAYSVLDDLGKQAVDVGLLSKGTWEKNLGEYIKNAYTKFELPKVQKGVWGFMKRGVKGIKARKPLTLAKRAEFGEIKNPAYLLAKSMMDLQVDIENTKLFNLVAKKLGSITAKEGFQQLPISRRLFTTATEEKIQMLSKIKNLGKDMKPVIRALKQTFKADKKVLGEIHSIEKTLGKLGILRKEEFFKFFQAGQKITKAIPEWRRLGTLPDDLISIGRKAKGFKTFKALEKSDTGIAVEKLFREGVLERRGFSSMENFFDYVKHPFKVKPAKIVETIAEENVQKLIKLQKGIENLSLKAGKIKGLDKRSIDDAYRFLEDTLSKMGLEKEELMERVGKVALGELSGKYVPTPIFDSIQEITRSRTAWDKSVGKLVAGFKFGKVVMNPATHGRNIISNTVLNWWKLGLGPWRLDRYAEAGKELATKGKYYKEAVIAGMDESTYFAQEIGNLLLGPDTISTWGKGNKLWKKSVSKLGNIYQGEEKFAKLAAFIHKRKAGLATGDAWAAAESATFNYAQITPFIRKLRESLFGFPFITFTYKATPVAIETAIKHPGRISAIGKIKTAIENQSDIHLTARERASEPSWVKNGFYIKLPIKDKYGRSSYFDLTYIMPFGDLVSGDFIERQIGRETGVQEGVVPAIARKSPFFNVVKELTSNQDFYGNKIWKDGDSTNKQLGDVFRHLTKTYMPPLIADQIPGGYITEGKMAGQRRPSLIARTKEAQDTQYRTLMQEMLRNVGLKVQPIDVDIQENYMEWEKKKALQTLLTESGVMKEFQRYYVPK